MIRCEDVLREISDYLDREVSAELRRQIEEHLNGCENCRVLVNTTRKTISLVGASTVFEIPADVSERLMKRFSGQAASRAGRSTPIRLTLLAGLAAMLVVTSSILYLQRERTLEGTISDTSCGAEHGMRNISAAECTLKCVEMGAKYALVSGGEVYELDGMTDELKAFAGQKVRLSGDVSGKTIRVDSVSAG
jgi:predicted anti-sigma-YlaC factor YlaD